MNVLHLRLVKERDSVCGLVQSTPPKSLSFTFFFYNFNYCWIRLSYLQHSGHAKIALDIAAVEFDQFLSRISILTRDIDIANLSVCLSVCP